MRDLHKVLNAFSFSDLQTFRNILLNLKMNNHTIYEALEYITRTEQGFINMGKSGAKCMECGHRMFLHPVNTKDCNQVGGDYTHQWWCGFCDTSFFITNKHALETPQNLMEEIRKIEGHQAQLIKDKEKR